MTNYLSFNCLSLDDIIELHPTVYIYENVQYTFYAESEDEEDENFFDTVVVFRFSDNSVLIRTSDYSNPNQNIDIERLHQNNITDENFYNEHLRFYDEENSGYSMIIDWLDREQYNRLTYSQQMLLTI